MARLTNFPSDRLNMMKNANCLPLWLCLWIFLYVPHPVDAQTPRLSISSTNNQSFVLSWPAAATGYVIESVGELPGESWLAVTAQPTSANGELRLERNVSGKAQFYRLSLAPVLSAADFEIAGYQLINRTIISPTLSEETYKADVSNWSAADASVSAMLTGIPNGVTLIAGSLNFGDVPAGATLESSNAFTVRRDSSQPFDGATLVWTPVAKPLPPTTFALIDKALADGRISAETALVYKVYDDFNDERLPLQYRGRNDGFPDGSAILKAERLWTTLSPVTKQLLAPFRLLPTDPGSWVEIQAARQSAAAPELRSTATPGRLTAQADSSTNIQWSIIKTANGKVRIWWMTTRRPADEARAQAIAGEIDRYLWSKLTDLMGEPKLIPGADGVVRLDIYLTSKQRPETKPFILDADGNQICTGNPLPAVILLGPKDTNSDLAHEMMHAILHGYRLKSCFAPDYRWMHEATATWAEHFAYPLPNPEHGGNGRRGAYSYLEDPTLPLDRVDDDREYGAYLWFFFLTRGTSSGTPPYVRQIWDAAATLDGVSAVNAAIQNIGGFEKQWPEFALYNWNRMEDGGEPYRYYYNWDKLKHKVKEHGPTKVTLDGKTSAVEIMSHLLPYLSADYFHYDFESDKKIRRIDFINPVYSTGIVPGAKVQAIVKIRGQGWKPAEDWTALATKRFCRDRPSEDVEQLVIVISNSQFTKGPDVGEFGQPPPEIQVSSLGCNPWEGTVRYTRVYRSDFSVPGISSTIEEDDLTYDGNITELVEEDGDVLQAGSTWQSWTFKLAGQFTASRLDSGTTTAVTDNFTVTDTDVTQGDGNPAAEGEIMIRFDNDLFNFVSVSAGLGTQRYEIPLQRTTERKVECRKAGSCPEPIPAETKPFGAWTLSFAESPSKNSPNTIVISTNDTLKVSLTRTSLEEYQAPFAGQNETTETLTVDLIRTRAP